MKPIILGIVLFVLGGLFYFLRKKRGGKGGSKSTGKRRGSALRACASRR
jgi:LPXTG-motif cell wall-anchored protein